MATSQTDQAQFSNLQVEVKGIGLAYDSDTYKVHYLEFAGPSQACEAIRASMHKKNGGIQSARPWVYSNLTAVPAMEFDKARLPDSPEVHFMLWDPNPALIIVRPKTIMLSDIRKLREGETDQRINMHNRKEFGEYLVMDYLRPYTHRHYILPKFVQVLNEITRVPVLPEWAAAIWEAAPDNVAITRLDTHGSVLDAYIINPAYEWTQLIQKLLSAGYINIPPVASSMKPS